MVARIVLFVMLFIQNILFAGLSFQSLDISGGMKDDANKIRILFGEDSIKKQKVLDNLKLEQQSLEKREKDLEDLYQKKVLDIKSSIESLKKDGRNSDFISKKLMFFNKLDQLLLEKYEVKKQILDALRRHIEFWEKYFGQSKNNNVIEEKSLYTFADLQDITNRIALEDEQRTRFVSKKEEEITFSHREEHVVHMKDREIKNVEKDIEDLKKQIDSKSIKNEVEILDLEKEVLTQEKELAELKVDLHKKEADLYESRVIILQEKLKELRDSMSIMRNLIHIDKSEVVNYEAKANEIRKEVTVKKDALIDQKNSYMIEKNVLQESLSVLNNRYNISSSDLQKLEDWDLEIEQSLENFGSYIVAYENLKIVLMDRLLQKNKVELAIEDAKLEQAQVFSESIKSLYDITQGFFKENDFLDKERFAFKELKQTLISDIKKAKAEVTAAHAFIKDQHKVVNNIKKQQEKLKTFATKIILANQKKHGELSDVLVAASDKLEALKDVSLILGEAYTKLADIKEETLENVSFLLQELELIGVWHRATSAVTWEGIKNIIPNLAIFFKEVYSIFVSYIKYFDIHEIAYNISEMDFTDIFLFFLMLFILFIFFVLIQAFLPSLYKTLMIDDEFVSFYALNCFFAVIVRFMLSVYKLLFFWMLFFIFSLFYKVSIAIKLLFYLYSISFWIYASRIFLIQFLYVNRQSDYVLLHKRLIERFSFVFSFFSISTVIILFFRKMFMLVMIYQQSEFPNVLLRIYHVVIFISIIFSIDREELLHAFPTKNRFWKRISFMVQQYYYLFLMMILGLLVMSDPYLGGYGSLIWYVFWNSLFTIAILVVLFMAHRIVRQYTEGIFFEEDDISSGHAERFEYAKTWYGFYIFFLYLVFIFLAVLLCANIWGYSITYHTFKSILYYQLPLGIETGRETKFLKVIDFGRMLSIIFIGFLLSYVLRRFLLEKIFEFYYVDLGVQNTVTIISRYVIIFTSIMAALAYAGLYHVISYIWLVGLVTFGWSFKDLFTDIVAYFFILVQRPLKLGDYVKIDNCTMGVVRKISPRAVILRRKNSVSVVVPNSMILKSPLYNWNYAGSYIGFDDILFSVPFNTDIRLVKEILIKVLDNDPDVLKVPQPIIRLDDFSDKGYVFMIRGFLSSGNTLRQWDIASNVRFAIVEQLALVGIQIAAPSVKILLTNNSVDTFSTQIKP